MPTVTLNGKPRELPDGATVADAVRAVGAPEDGRGVAAAVDGEVVPRGKWASRMLATDERIKSRDYPLAIALATRGVELSKEADAAVIDTLAYALFASGKIDEAIAWQTKAVALTKGEDKEIAAALEKYKKAKGGS